MKTLITLSMILCSLMLRGDSWTRKADAPGLPRYQAVGFSISSHGYLALGVDTSATGTRNDVWQYDTISDSWAQKADYAGRARSNAVGFTIKGGAYVGTGADSNYAI